MAFALLIAFAVVLVMLLTLLAFRQRRSRRWPPSPAKPPDSAGELDRKIARLARAGWPTREAARGLRLTLSGNLPSDLQGFVEALITHIRRVAPKLNVPHLVPRVTIESSALWAGQFVEEDGWVKISISANFEEHKIAIRAILCHEVCHYVLSASGIKRK